MLKDNVSSELMRKNETEKYLNISLKCTSGTHALVFVHGAYLAFTQCSISCYFIQTMNVKTVRSRSIIDSTGKKKCTMSGQKSFEQSNNKYM